MRPITQSFAGYSDAVCQAMTPSQLLTPLNTLNVPSGCTIDTSGFDAGFTTCAGVQQHAAASCITQHTASCTAHTSQAEPRTSQAEPLRDIPAEQSH